MFEHIVVPLDGARLAEQALGPAVSVAREEDAHIHLVTVESPTIVDLEPSLGVFDEDYLESVAASVREVGVSRVSTKRLEGGGIAHALEAYRTSVGAGLTVMCTHGRGVVQRAWLGSVADALVRTSEAPVLLVRATDGAVSPMNDLRAAKRFERVLVALDGSHFSREALESAARLGGKSAVYILARVVAGAGEAADERSKKDRTLAEAKMSLEVQSFASGGYTVESITDFAPSVAQGILDFAKRREADIVVIATHARRGVERLILGSVADKVIRGADLPVLVVRPRGP
ncbi:MAG: universal stress protein [Gemmatimonadota bacterium]